MKNIKTFLCKNPNSKFKGILNYKIINGLKSYSFVFYPDSEICYWPISTSYYELLQDGWIPQ